MRAASATFAVVLTLSAPVAATETTVRVSLSNAGAQANGTSIAPHVSADGRFVAFQSDASNLVSGDTNSVTDAFVRDRQTGTTTRISVSSRGGQGNDHSFVEAITPDGRYVAFTTRASNLVAGDSNESTDVLVRDLHTGTTTAVSVSTGGVIGDSASHWASISSDGRYVAFTSFAANLVAGDGNRASDVFVHDRRTATTTMISVAPDNQPGDNASVAPSISADGRFVAYMSHATNLIVGDTNGGTDVFLRDRTQGTTELVSATADGMPGNASSAVPAISADGRYVAFDSVASDLVDGDTNGFSDVFYRDRQTASTKRVSVSTGGSEGNGGSGSAGGEFAGARISPDGRYIVFTSAATDLVPEDTNQIRDAFVHDSRAGQTTRVSLSATGMQLIGESGFVETIAISGDGKQIGFSSPAANAVTSDTNGHSDIFVRGLTPVLDSSFTDTCDGVNTTVTNRGVDTEAVSLIRRQTGIDPFDGVPGQQHIILRPGQSHTASVKPEQGRGFSLRWQPDRVLDIADESHSWTKPASCEDLPVTGMPTLPYLIFGSALVCAGAIIFLLTRRPRPTLISPRQD